MHLEGVFYLFLAKAHVEGIETGGHIMHLEGVIYLILAKAREREREVSRERERF